MKKIPLTQGQFALVSDRDYKELSKYKWYARRQRKTYYAKRHYKVVEGRPIHILMHTQIMGTPSGMDIDHRDGNGLNNQRRNLRVTTRSQNMMNKGKPSNNTSGFKGVSLHKQKSKWQAEIVVNGKRIYLGIYSTPEIASKSYIKACKKYHGAFGNY